MKKNYLYSGIFILIVLFVSYFIRISNYSVDGIIRNDTLLGIIIFHNPFILGLYVLAAVALIFSGKESKRR